MIRAFAILAFVASIAFAVSPFYVNGFNGFEASQFPVPQENAPVQPSGYAFSIWGVIYLWLIAGLGFGLLNRADDEGWAAARAPLFISLAVGTSWLAVAQMSVLWATLLIWVMLVTALSALVRAGLEDRWWLREPIGLYAGWLTAASSVSVGLVLAGYGYTSQTMAAIIALVIAIVIAVAIQKARPDTLAYPAAVIWALVGVIVSNFDPINAPVLGLAVVGAGYLGLNALQHR